jgi:hypothetical protein
MSALKVPLATLFFSGLGLFIVGQLYNIKPKPFYYYRVGINETYNNVCPSKNAAEIAAKAIEKDLSDPDKIYKAQGCALQRIKFTVVKQVSGEFISDYGYIWRIIEVIDENDPQKTHRFFLTRGKVPI